MSDDKKNSEMKGFRNLFRNGSPKKNKSEKYENSICLLNVLDSPCLNRRSNSFGENDSPFEAASAGKLKDFQRLYEDDNSILNNRDDNGAAPIHYASINGHIDIINFILSRDGDIDIQDAAGNTSLHLAIENQQICVIEVLIRYGADTTKLNGDNMAPVHFAVDIGSIEALEVILNLNKESANLQDPTGSTPLHYCAPKDRSECAKILLRNGGKPCLKCNGGFYPIHHAATQAADKTLNVLIEHVQSYGYTRTEVLSFTDKYNNTPLHSAVNGGDLDAVRVCINAGAPVDVQQEDKSTPLHFACAQGSVETVKLMKELQPDRFRSAMNTFDVLDMTPLHRASLFNHTDVVKFLIDEGADINVQDVQNRTPLLLAASKGGWKCVHCLLENGADISIKDKTNRNFLHMAIEFGVRLNHFSVDVIKHLKTLLNEKDDMGCTPLHFASQAGHLVAIDDLISLGATINAKNNEKQSPLHFAARYGRINTCRRLLNSPQGANIINDTDGEGMTALHVASLHGHTKIINVLMQKGANLTRAVDDNSPLHMAVMNGYTKSMKLLLGVHANLLDATNIFDNTALHLAAELGQTSAVELLLTMGAKLTLNKDDKSFLDLAIENKQNDVALAVVRHERWQEALNLCSPKHGFPMNGFIQYLPEVCLAVLDRCQTSSGGLPSRPDYYIEYNFLYLQYPFSCLKYQNENGEDVLPMVALNLMVKYGRVECLSHPVCKTFLSMKWRAYGMWFHSINLIIYIAYLMLLTFLVTTTFEPEYENKTIISGNSTNGSTDNFVTTVGVQMPVGSKIGSWVLLLLMTLNVIKEVVQMVQQRLKYFTDMNNLVEWVLYVSTALFLAPYLLGHSINLNWEAGTIAVFLAWFNCLLFLQRFDFFGLYVVMFLEILVTLLKAFCVYSILIVAFGLAFHILLRHEDSHAYNSPGLSILRTAMMMLELDYMSSFNDPYVDNNDRTLPYGKLTLFFLAVFVLLMPILLINLLIGLAVGDIEAVRKNATLKRLAMQVELHTDLERRLPHKLIEKVDKVNYKFYPNGRFQMFSKVWSLMTFGNLEESQISSETSREREYFKQEMYKQKMRLKEISSSMEKHYELLRLVVQKMDIRTEDDNRDEGFHTSQTIDHITPARKMNHWKTPQNVVQTTSVVSKWKSSSRNAQMKFDEC